MLDTSPVTGRGSAVHLRFRQERSEVCNAKPVLACGSEVRLKNLSHGLSESWRVFCRKRAKPGAVGVFLACYALAVASRVRTSAC